MYLTRHAKSCILQKFRAGRSISRIFCLTPHHNLAKVRVYIWSILGNPPAVCQDLAHGAVAVLVTFRSKGMSHPDTSYDGFHLMIVISSVPRSRRPRRGTYNHANGKDIGPRTITSRDLGSLSKVLSTKLVFAIVSGPSKVIPFAGHLLLGHVSCDLYGHIISSHRSQPGFCMPSHLPVSAFSPPIVFPGLAHVFAPSLVEIVCLQPTN